MSENNTLSSEVSEDEDPEDDIDSNTDGFHTRRTMDDSWSEESWSNDTTTPAASRTTSESSETFPFQDEERKPNDPTTDSLSSFSSVLSLIPVTSPVEKKDTEAVNVVPGLDVKALEKDKKKEEELETRSEFMDKFGDATVIE